MATRIRIGRSARCNETLVLVPPTVWGEGGTTTNVQFSSVGHRRTLGSVAAATMISETTALPTSFVLGETLLDR